MLFKHEDKIYPPNSLRWSIQSCMITFQPHLGLPILACQAPATVFLLLFEYANLISSSWDALLQIFAWLGPSWHYVSDEITPLHRSLL
jgi:hypothetical protein